MGEYLSFASECLQSLKPKVEEKTGIKLEDLVVKDPCKVLHHECNGLMFIMPHNLYSDTIFVNEKKCQEEGMHAPLGITHELAHKTHRKLVDAGLKKTKKFPLWDKHVEYEKMRSFKEGFAEYMSLCYLANIHQDDLGTLLEIAQRRDTLEGYQDFEPRDIPYERGYKFFKKVLSVVGEDKVFEVARTLPMNEAEVRIPLLYLLRHYPSKGIKSMPKFLARGIKTKILKKIYGYADFDFPNQP